jgi:rSAM/selenodomain-associated transferase 1
MSESLRDRCAIAVMAKAPRPGRVKTRLCPPLIPEEAMELSAAFLRDITENIRAAASDAPVDGWIAYAPAGDEHAFDGILAQGTRLLLADGAIAAPAGVEGFGKCLLHAIQDLLARGYGAAVVLNSDSPTLPTARLRETAEALLRPGARAVLGPADDGGYYLLGLQGPHAGAFADIAWSTDIVAAQTRARVAALGLDLVDLPPWYDVDNEAALTRLIADLSGPPARADAPYPAVTTAACVERLALPSRLTKAA